MQTLLSNGGRLALRDSGYAKISVTYSDHSVLINLPHYIDNIIELPRNQLLCSHQQSNKVYVVDAQSGKLICEQLLPLHPKTKKVLTIEQMILLENRLVTYTSANEDNDECWLVTINPHTGDLINLWHQYQPASDFHCMLALPNNLLIVAYDRKHILLPSIVILDMTSYSFKQSIYNYELEHSRVDQLVLQADNTLLAIFSGSNSSDSLRRKLINFSLSGEIIAEKSLAPDEICNLNDFNTINVGLTSLPLALLPLELIANIAKYLSLAQIFTLLCTQQSLNSLKQSRALFSHAELFPGYPHLNNTAACLLSNDLVELQRLIEVQELNAEAIIYQLDEDETKCQQTGNYLLELARKSNNQAALDLFYRQLIQPFYIKNPQNDYNKYRLLLSLQCNQTFEIVNKFIDALFLLATLQQEKCLQLALDNHKDKIIAVLFKKGSSLALDSVLNYLNTIISQQIALNDLHTIELIISSLDQTNVWLFKHLAPNILSTAIQYNQLAVVKLFTDKNALLSKTAYMNSNPLLKAVRLNHLNCLELLLKSGRCNKDYINLTMEESIAGNNIAAVKFLLQNNVDPNQTMQNPFNDKFTYLRYAAQKNFYSICELLLKSPQIDINNTSDYKSALYNACAAGHATIVALLFKHGASVYRMDEYNRSAFFMACQFGHLDCAKLMTTQARQLSEVKANKYFTYPGATPAYIAACYGHLPILNFLNECNVDLFIPDNYDKTSITISLTYENYQVARWLLAQPTIIVSAQDVEKVNQGPSPTDVKYLIKLKDLMQDWQVMVANKSAHLFASSNNKIRKSLKAAERLYQDILANPELLPKHNKNVNKFLKKIIDQYVAYFTDKKHHHRDVKSISMY